MMFNSQRLITVDGLRGLAILSILILHYGVLPLVRVEGSSLAPVVRLIGSHLWSGVDLFFVLSGFLITSGLLKERNHPHCLGRFFVRRLFRILPLYWLLLLAYLVLTAYWQTSFKGSGLIDRSFPFYVYASLTQNFFLARTGEYGSDLLAATWSLALEVQFYCLVPLLVKWFNDRCLLVICAILVIASIAARVLHDYPASYSYPFCRGDGLFMGVAIAVLFQAYYGANFYSHAHKYERFLLPVSMAIYFFTALVLPNAGGVLNHLLFSLAYSGLLIALLIGKKGEEGIVGVFSSPFLTWLGRKSYGIYLFHYGVLVAVFHLLQAKQPRLEAIDDFIVTAGALALTLFVVTYLNKWVEEPMIRIGKNLVGKT